MATATHFWLKKECSLLDWSNIDPWYFFCWHSPLSNQVTKRPRNLKVLEIQEKLQGHIKSFSSLLNNISKKKKKSQSIRLIHVSVRYFAPFDSPQPLVRLFHIRLFARVNFTLCSPTWIFVEGQVNIESRESTPSWGEMKSRKQRQCSQFFHPYLMICRAWTKRRRVIKKRKYTHFFSFFFFRRRPHWQHNRLCFPVTLFTFAESIKKKKQEGVRLPKAKVLIVHGYTTTMNEWVEENIRGACFGV